MTRQIYTWACPKCGYQTDQWAFVLEITHRCPVDHRDRKLKLLPPAGSVNTTTNPKY